MTMFLGDRKGKTVSVDENGQFKAKFEESFDLRGQAKSDPFSYPVSFRFLWKDELAYKGEVLKPHPDHVDFNLEFSPNGILRLIDASGNPNSSLKIQLAFEKVIDKKRKKEITRTKTVRFKKERINELVKRTAIHLPNVK